MSRDATGQSDRVLQCREDFASNIAFETTDDLSLAHSLSGAALHIRLGSVVITKSDQDDAIESLIGLAVATAVQPVPVGLAGGRRYRIHPAEGDEGSLGAKALRVAAGRDQQSRRRVGSYAKGTKKLSQNGKSPLATEPQEYARKLQQSDVVRRLFVVAYQNRTALGEPC